MLGLVAALCWRRQRGEEYVPQKPQGYSGLYEFARAKQHSAAGERVAGAQERRLFWLAWSSAIIIGSIAMSSSAYYYYFGHT